MTTVSRAPRVAGIAPDELTAQQRSVYEAVAGGRRAQGPQAFRLTDDAGRLRGPFNAMLLSPPLGDALQNLGAAVRYAGELTDRERELAILTVAARWQSAFEWAAHTAIGSHVGLAGPEIDAVAAGGALPASVGARESAVVTWARTLAHGWDADDRSYVAAIAALGERLAYEVSVLVGYYSVLAMQLRVFGDEHDPEAGS